MNALDQGVITDSTELSAFRLNIRRLNSKIKITLQQTTKCAIANQE